MLKSSQQYTGMVHAYVCVEGVGGGGGGGCLSCVCVWANVYVCICHSRDRKKIFHASVDKNSLEIIESY